MSDNYRPEYDAYGLPKPPDPSLWGKGVCTSYPGSTYGCGCRKCHEKLIETVENLGAPAPSPLAREAVGEFMETTCPCRWIITTPKHTKKDCPHYTFSAEQEWLLATVARVEAATEARVRAEVWCKAHEAVKDLGVKENVEKFFADKISEAALADGVDLTSIPKTE